MLWTSRFFSNAVTIVKIIKASYFQMELLFLLSKIVILEIFVQKKPDQKPTPKTPQTNKQTRKAPKTVTSGFRNQ